MKTGIAGYSGSGVTTLIALFSGDTGLAEKRSGPEIRSVSIEDARLGILTGLFKPKKTTSVQLDIVELGDLRPQEGGGLRKDTIARAAGLEAMTVVLRGFEAPQNQGCRQPDELLKELSTLREEFCFTDLLPVENRLGRLSKEGKLSSPEAVLLEKLQAQLEEGLPIRLLDLTREEKASLSGYQFMTLTPLIVIVNKGEDGAGQLSYTDLANRCTDEGLEYLEICGLSELELLELPHEERKPFLEELGIIESSGDVFVSKVFALLELITFFTVGEKEVKGWAIKSGTQAVHAAGKIHTDMERGFIRAEVIQCDDLAEFGSLSAAREAGKLRSEGKEYVVKDGEVVHVLFNV